MCRSGIPTNIQFPTPGSEITWNCLGTGVFGEDSATCRARIPVTGTCGSADGFVFEINEISTLSYEAYDKEQCTYGSPTDTRFPPTGTSVTWVCTGAFGGADSDVCEARRPAGREDERRT